MMLASLIMLVSHMFITQYFYQGVLYDNSVYENTFNNIELTAKS